MIKVENLTKIYRTPEKSTIPIIGFFSRTYKTSTAVDKLSFEIGAGELVGFIGPNGAGKTTTMKILSGILYPTSGNVKVLGFTPFEKNQEFLKQIAFVMGQKNQLLWELPPTDSFQLNKEIYEIEDSVYKKRVSELVELLDASSFINQPVKTLSLGQRMRAELIASLLHYPKILFLDEPTIGLDIFAQTTIINFIKEYQQRQNATIVLTTHYMQDVQRLAKRVIMINNGKLLYDGSLSELVNHYSHQKQIHITLEQELKKNFELPKKIKYTYQFPQLSFSMSRDDLSAHLPEILSGIDFSDLTVEEEAIEDVIKKLYKKS